MSIAPDIYVLVALFEYLWVKVVVEVVVVAVFRFCGADVVI